MKIFPILAVLIFGAAGVANAQVGEPSGIGDRAPVTESEGGYGQQQGTSGGSGYGTSGTGRYENEPAQELDGDGRDGRRLPYEGGGYGGYGLPSDSENDQYDYSGVDGTGPKLKGRY